MIDYISYHNSILFQFIIYVNFVNTLITLTPLPSSVIHLVRHMQGSKKKNNFVIGRIMCTFSLNLIQMSIKKSYIKPSIAKEDPTQNTILTKFEPLIKLVINCIRSNDNNIITSSIRILNAIISWPLLALKKNYKKIIAASF